MNRFTLTVGFLTTSILVAATPPTLAAEKATDWPHWRGPTGNGISPDGQPPIEWSEQKNVKWKVPVAGKGSGSPIVAKGKIFVVTAVSVGGSESSGGEGEPRGGEQRGRRGRRGGRGRGRSAPTNPYRFVLMCLDRETGKTLWEKTAAEAKPHEATHPTNTFASGSPCTDGERVYAYFGSQGLFCYDTDGKEVWKRTDLGKLRMRNGFGEGSSPTLHGDTIILPWDNEGPSYLAVLDKRTGKTIWKEERDEPSCWATPLVVEHDGRKQIIVSGQNFARGYDYKTGKELWRCSGQTDRPVASPVAGHGLVFVGSGYQGAYLGAFRLADAKGDIKGTKGVAWSVDSNTPDVPSPLLSGRRLYFHGGRSGRMSCHDAVTGKAHYSAQRVDGLDSVYASPVAANGKLYLTARSGTTVVIEDADELKVVATNRLGDGIDATPAISGREIFIRSSGHVYCIAE